MKYKNIFIMAVALFLVSACSTRSLAPVKVRNVKNLPVSHSLQGFYYNLPKSVVTVEIKVLVTEEVPGPFRQYASKYLGIEDVISERSENYAISSVDIGTYAKPDEDHFYFVEYTDENLGEYPFSIHLNDAGLITGINTSEGQYNIQDNVQKAIDDDLFGSKSTFNRFIETNLQEKIDTIVERIQQDTITIERKKLRRTWVEKSSEVRAKEIADYIINIRNKKFDLINGFAEITYDKSTLQYMVDQLEEEENSYLELFTGITLMDYRIYKFEMIPEKDDMMYTDTLMHFSDKLGATYIENLYNTPVTLNINASEDTKQMSVFTMNPTLEEEVNRGIYYRIPEYAQLEVKVGENSIAQARLIINQLGTITSLPPENFEIEFYPETGSIKSVKRVVRANN